MRRSVLVFLLLILFAIVLLAQTRAAKPASQQRPSQTAASPEVNVEVVESFMRHTFGWNPDLKWQIAGIAPSPASDIVEVHVVMTTPQGQQPLTLFITPDKQWAINGELVPFGADPFARTRQQLVSGVKGPAKGP